MPASMPQDRALLYSGSREQGRNQKLCNRLSCIYCCVFTIPMGRDNPSPWGGHVNRRRPPPQLLRAASAAPRRPASPLPAYLHHTVPSPSPLDPPKTPPPSTPLLSTPSSDTPALSTSSPLSSQPLIPSTPTTPFPLPLPPDHQLPLIPFFPHPRPLSLPQSSSCTLTTLTISSFPNLSVRILS